MLRALSGHRRRQSSAKESLPAGILQLLDKPASEQAAFWVDQAEGLDPVQTQFPPDKVLNDTLGRYFDATSEGIGRVFQKVASEGSDGELRLGRKGLHNALVNHFGLFKDASYESEGSPNSSPDLQHLDAIWSLLGGPCGRESFEHVVRRLRIGTLLASGLEETKLYFYGYDDDEICGSFRPSLGQVRVRQGNHNYLVPEVSEQVAVGDKDSDTKSIGEFLFTDKFTRGGRVHWVHAHDVSIRLVLALGQLYRMPAHVQGVMSDLKRAQPQLEANSRPVTSTEESAIALYTWSALVMPVVLIDQTARQSLERYDVWFQNQERDAKSARNSAPPRIKVAALSLNLSLLWSDTAANTLVSMTSEPLYVGRWVTDGGKDHGLHDTLYSVKAFFVSCVGRCGRRMTGNLEGEALSEDDGDAAPFLRLETGITNTECTDLIEKYLDETFEPGSTSHMGRAAEGEEARSTHFEQAFQKVLQQLGESGSLLRMGSHAQLVSRIILNMTVDYLDVINLYRAAITRVEDLLRDTDQRRKADLVAKIALATLELGHLLRLIRPMVDDVLPELERLDLAGQGFPPHHLKDITNNLRRFAPKCVFEIERCQSLISEYDRAAGNKMSRVLNILTVITFIVMPIQLLTGLYGMNFKYMPELEWHYGYLFFFCLACTLSVCSSGTLAYLYRVAT